MPCQALRRPVAHHGPPGASIGNHFVPVLRTAPVASPRHARRDSNLMRPLNGDHSGPTEPPQQASCQATRITTTSRAHTTSNRSRPSRT